MLGALWSEVLAYTDRRNHVVESIIGLDSLLQHD